MSSKAELQKLTVPVLKEVCKELQKSQGKKVVPRCTGRKAELIEIIENAKKNITKTPVKRPAPKRYAAKKNTSKRSTTKNRVVCTGNKCVSTNMIKNQIKKIMGRIAVESSIEHLNPEVTIDKVTTAYIKPKITPGLTDKEITSEINKNKRLYIKAIDNINANILRLDYENLSMEELVDLLKNSTTDIFSDRELQVLVLYKKNALSGF